MAGIALSATLLSAGAACTGGDRKDTGPLARLAISPGNGGAKVAPDSPIIVQAFDGTLQDVTITTKGNKVEGGQTAGGTRWQSRWTLDPGTKYQVVATALGRDGKTRSVTSNFTTLKADNPIATRIEAPADHEKVGVGMPIVLHFSKDVQNKKAVEKALVVRSTKPVMGAWHWFGPQDLVFRTKEHWPRHTKVEFLAHMSGVRAAKNVFGARNLDLKFEIGEQQSSVAGEDDHQMVVSKNGKTVRTIPISMGRGGITKYTTTNGNHLTMDKAQAVLMDSSTVGCGPGCPGYYREMVYWAVRISNSGEYAHSAPWSVGSQGNSNVSHGCVNMSPSNAIWFYNFSQRGDPYKITGTDRELEPDNGWGYWQLSWPGWLKGGPRPFTTDRLFSAPSASATATPSTSLTPSPSGTPSPSPSPSVSVSARPSASGTPTATATVRTPAVTSVTPTR
ncbi:MAG: ErfK/YbiS/YcfS/YnhG family protein [Streptosporangiaceae bacterium]|nr:ErfK/YbiS/YcfS/YnhG family protein [Streptosporangiaceae bacterium]